MRVNTAEAEDKDESMEEEDKDSIQYRPALKPQFPHKKEEQEKGEQE